MPEENKMPMMQETGLESPPPTSQEGYRIFLSVLPDGFEVSEPEPLAPSPQSPDLANEREIIPDLTTALKHILAVVKKNPIGADAQEQFTAGYGAK